MSLGMLMVTLIADMNIVSTEVHAHTQIDIDKSNNVYPYNIHTILMVYF